MGIETKLLENRGVIIDFTSPRTNDRVSILSQPDKNIHVITTYASQRIVETGKIINDTHTDVHSPLMHQCGDIGDTDSCNTKDQHRHRSFESRSKLREVLKQQFPQLYLVFVEATKAK